MPPTSLALFIKETLTDRPVAFTLISGNTARPRIAHAEQVRKVGNYEKFKWCNECLSRSDETPLKLNVLASTNRFDSAQPWTYFKRLTICCFVRLYVNLTNSNTRQNQALLLSKKVISEGNWMLTSYPSKNFFTDVKNTLLKNERFRIAIKKGWRSRLLAQEVESWISAKSGVSFDGKAGKSPSLFCNVFMMPFLSMHWLALSSHYRMNYFIEDEQVICEYVPDSGDA